MAKIFGIDIPSGLEEAYFKILQFANSITQDVVQQKGTIPTRTRKYAWKTQSLFLLWQDLYGGFDSTRKNAWTAYWITLPFSDHGGGNGWPGSGYSAFIYVNAPRYANGDDLLLDPPAGNLIVNGYFTDGLNNWNYDPDYATEVDNFCVFASEYYDGFNPVYIRQTIETLVFGNEYHIEFDAYIPDSSGADDRDIILGIFLNTDMGGGYGETPLPEYGYVPIFQNGDTNTHYSFNFIAYDGAEYEVPEFGVYIQEQGSYDFGETVRISNIVLSPV